MNINIAKFKLYPTDNPTGYAVGFNITTSNDRMFYMDTIISLDLTSNKTDDEIISLAWDNVKLSAEVKCQELEVLNSLLKNQWVPPNERVEDSETPEEEA